MLLMMRNGTQNVGGMWEEVRDERICGRSLILAPEDRGGATGCALSVNTTMPRSDSMLFAHGQADLHLTGCMRQ